MDLFAWVIYAHYMAHCIVHAWIMVVCHGPVIAMFQLGQ